MHFDSQGSAKTSRAIREQIRQSTASHAELARRFGITAQTVRKWRQRDSVADGSHRPKRLQTTLDGAQEDLMVGMRVALRLSLDPLLQMGRNMVSPTLTRSALDRTLRRRDVSNLARLRPQWPARNHDRTIPNALLLTLFPVRYGGADQHRVLVLVGLDSATGQATATCRRHLTTAALSAFVHRLVRGSNRTLLGPDGVERRLSATALSADDRLVPGELHGLLSGLRSRARELARASPGRTVGTIAEDPVRDCFRPPVPDRLQDWCELLTKALDVYHAQQASAADP